MKEYKVNLPKESYSLVEFKQEDLPGVALLNHGLRGFEPREVFSWHFSLMIELEDLVENGMPSKKEKERVEKFEGELKKIVAGENLRKPNGLYLGRITWNATREIIWRVYNPEIIHLALKEGIRKNIFSVQFDYRIDPDEEWKLAEWHLKE